MIGRARGPRNVAGAGMGGRDWMQGSGHGLFDVDFTGAEGAPRGAAMGPQLRSQARDLAVQAAGITWRLFGPVVCPWQLFEELSRPGHQPHPSGPGLSNSLFSAGLMGVMGRRSRHPAFTRRQTSL
jgi:hypothetical protein